MSSDKLIVTVKKVLEPIKYENPKRDIYLLYPVVSIDDTGKEWSVWAIGKMGEMLIPGDRIEVVKAASLIRGGDKLVVVRKLKG